MGKFLPTYDIKLTSKQQNKLLMLIAVCLIQTLCMCLLAEARSELPTA